MKRKSLIYVLLSLFICSCTNDIDTTVENCNVPNNHAPNTDGKFKIDEVKALSIANNFFKSSTRGSSDFVMDYVKSSEPNLTRGGDFVYDTLAYILNRGDGEGFIVVSSDNRVFPVLAYSETGTFSDKESMEDPVYANFISRLDGYLKSAENKDSVIEVPDDYLLRCVHKDPVVDSSWHQFSPYNKYVVREEPSCPVGCVALACAQAMIHCKDSLYLYDRKFNFSAIREAVSKKDTSITSYTDAIDDIAYLLFRFGREIGTKYDLTGSAAKYEKAIPVLKRIGYIVRQENPVYFVDSTIVNYILNEHIVCTSGFDYNHDVGHAWVIDGCAFCWKAQRPKTGVQNVFFHCNWGWGGECNGFYSGDFFSPGGYIFWNWSMKYFVVGKRGLMQGLI